MNNKQNTEMVSLTQKKDGVELQFSKELPEKIIAEQVSSCEAATCTCCTPEFRKNVEGFSSVLTDNGIRVKIKGTISIDQVRQNVLSCAPKLEKSKVKNSIVQKK